jgi:ribonuclease HI
VQFEIKDFCVNHFVCHTRKDFDDERVSFLLCESFNHDNLIWRHENDGLYSVKSAYKYCVEGAIDVSHLQVPGRWNLIWKTRAPPKVKNFVWRLCRNCLPTRLRLNQKGVNCPNHCVFCEESIEDSLHFFFLCNNSRQLWREAGWWHFIQPHLLGHTGVAEIVFSVLQVLTADACTILWSLWQQRNNKIWRNHNEPVRVVMDRANNMLSDWSAAQIKHSRQHQQQQTGSAARWMKPSQGRYKCNVDASFSSRLNRVGIGMCIRDDQGRFVIAKTVWKSPIMNVDLGEAIGLLSAIKWVHELQLHNVGFELDSKNVVAKFHGHREDHSELGDVIKDCQRLHASYFPNSSVEFIWRQANEVAHTLAKAASSLASFHLHIDIPPCIRTLIDNEMI